jgi:beta-lactam-binding protein with PASTA domain
VQDGAFTATVPLEVGANVVDVLASAGRRRPAMAAIRITRQTSVRVPDLAGASADDARDRLAELGLRPRIEEGGSILDDLLPIDAVVCSTSPGAGTEIDGGAEVEVAVSKLC